MEIPNSALGRFLGKRSIISWLFGSFFKNTANTSGLLAILLVGSVVYLYIRNGDVPNSLQNFVALILGFYFGGAVGRKIDEREE